MSVDPERHLEHGFVARSDTARGVQALITASSQSMVMLKVR